MGWENTPAQPKAGPASFQVRDTDGPVEMVTGPPPYYSTERQDYRQDYSNYPQRNMHEQSAAPWWNPRSWRKRTWAIVVAAVVIILVIVIVVPIEVTKANRYPNYTKLNYALADEYSGTTFFDKFNYFVGYDPAQGFVHYVPREQATQLNLTYASEDSAIIRVDTSVGPQSVPDASTGRFSVRLESQTQYENGLFIFDVKHTPFGCGTWPALWLVDPANWPDHGEIDVMEAANQATDGNQMTLHTTDGCTMDVKRIMSDSSLSNDCYNATDNNAGCGVRGSAATYGSAYNDAQGGIIAMEWRNEGIRVWQFGRSSIPTDITAKNPDPSIWGSASADFPNTNCDIGSHFKNQSIIANIDLCGQYASALYATSGCPSNCTDYVANNPDAFTNAFWEFGRFEVYKAT
ncbi:glycoside hydrolase family 16 protein [Daldinia caldariorum]|uniref:glycoside hydrolase family 16 protein n=1 Tax=Daldinia caldariorum TaxID=326644 RepID=UPI002007C85C|nr:glycoside hydrolase family 16 protein [Daldinia caldariorum]KAI1466289.1 glycoside hydrolase family 16 protein [Daldinia caldariorum]